MAEIHYYEGDSDEISDAGEDGSLGVASDGYDSDSSNPDAGLSPLQKLEKYMNSEHSYSRQVVARGLFETLVSLEDSQEETEKVFQAMWKLSCDSDSSVRAEIGEQIIRILMYLEKKPDLYRKALSEYLLPILTMYLKDLSIPVRKTSENTILSLVREKQVTDEEFESKVAPVIMEMSDADSNDDFRTEAVVLMTKFAPMLGSEITERVFLTRFTEMCNDALFHVRKVCASNFGEVCRVIGREVTEKILLPKFFYLCEDGVWGVRNACAECFMVVANICSPEVRRDELSVLFVNLLCDQSRWVRMAAFQALGGFISTFANPELTGLSLTEDGEIVSHELSGKQSVSGRKSSTTGDNDVFASVPKQNTSLTNDENSGATMPTENPINTSGIESNASDDPQTGGCSPARISNGARPTDAHNVVCSESSSAKSSGGSSDEISFDSFHYWRAPMSALDDFDMASDGRLVGCSFKADPVDGDASRSHDVSQTDMSQTDASGGCSAGSASTRTEEPVGNLAEQVDENGCSSVGSKEDDVNILGNEEQDDQKFRLFGVTSNDATSITSFGSESCFSGYIDAISDSEPLHKQTIVPYELLRHYLSMVNSSRAQTVDAEIMRHCAFSFPAVAYTLGRQNWPCLKELYETLARDMQWKVRRTLAFSIHELALILGAKLTSTDLLPIFDEFLKDLDEVRIGALKHLGEFLKLLSPDVRRKYLLKFPNFLDTDNTRNWRFRMDLAEQLLVILDLFSPTDVQEHLSPVAMTLAEDRVAQVRIEALKVLTGIARRLCLDILGPLWSDFISETNKRFAHSNIWTRRQSFVYLCDGLLETEAIDKNRFAVDFLPTLLQLGSDSVPNIRIAVARTLRNHVTSSEFFVTLNVSAELDRVIEHLKTDKDKDVRFEMDPTTVTTTATKTSTSATSDCETSMILGLDGVE